MGPIFEKLYPNDHDKMVEGLERHMLYFNTEPRWGAVLPGMVAVSYTHLDVYKRQVVREEPIRNDNPLLECDNCLITPHISWASKEARRRIMDTAVENLRCFLQGKEQNRIV